MSLLEDVLKQAEQVPGKKVNDTPEADPIVSLTNKPETPPEEGKSIFQYGDQFKNTYLKKR